MKSDIRASDGLARRARCRPRTRVERPERWYAHGARRRCEEHVGDGESPADAVQQQEAEKQALEDHTYSQRQFPAEKERRGTK